MPLIVRDNRKEWVPAPEGLHQAICFDVADLGMQPSAKWGMKEKLRIYWELVVLNDEGLELLRPEDGKRFVVSQQYTNSLNEKSNLHAALKSWRGAPFSKVEMKEGFDLEKLIGKNCQISVIHNLASDGRTFANVQTIVPIGRGMQAQEPSGQHKRRATKPEPVEEYDDGDVPF